MELEKQRGISITSTVMSFEYDGNHINLLDTPGHQVHFGDVECQPAERSSSDGIFFRASPGRHSLLDSAKS